LKQSETKDQTGKGAKIKGSNCNFSEGLDYKIIKTKGEERRAEQGGNTRRKTRQRGRKKEQGE
jgi:hypothetical protein